MAIGLEMITVAHRVLRHIGIGGWFNLIAISQDTATRVGWLAPAGRPAAHVRRVVDVTNLDRLVSVDDAVRLADH